MHDEKDLQRWYEMRSKSKKYAIFYGYGEKHAAFCGQVHGQKSGKQCMGKMEVGRMGRHGENIRKRRDGRWEARYMTYDMEKGKRICRSVYGHTYEEAKEKRLAAVMSAGLSDRADVQKQETGQTMDVLWGTVAEKWLAGIKSEQKPSTYEKYRHIYCHYLEAPLGKFALAQVTESFIKKTLPCEGISGSLKRSISCVLNRILQYASKKYHITPQNIRLDLVGKSTKTADVFTKSEQAKLLSAIFHEMDRFKLAILLCLFTGLRLGEICALKWTDIDFVNKTLVVKRTVQRLPVEGHSTKTALVETEPKSVRSIREIPLQDSLIALLRNYQDRKEYIFGGDRPLEPRTMQNHYKKILKEAEVDYKNFHTLRHTYATNCIEGGADVKSLSEMLGHSNVKITLNYYVHPSMDTKRMYVDNLYEFYARIRGQVQGKAG